MSKRKTKSGKLYLLYAQIEDNLHVYKYGVTTKDNTISRAKWIGRKFNTTFKELITFDVNDIYYKERMFRTFFWDAWKMEAAGIELECDEKIYSKSWECLASRSNIDDKLIEIMSDIVEAK